MSPSKLTDESKFLNWSYEIEMILRSKDLWNQVIYSSAAMSELFNSGLEGNLTIEATAEQVTQRVEIAHIEITPEITKTWNKNDRKAIAFISLSVGELFYPIVREPANHSARLLFAAIRRRCQAVNNSLRLSLEDQYNRLTMKETETLREFLDRTTAITNKLAAMNHPVEEERICTKILSSMTPRYEPIRLTIFMQPPEQLTLNNLRQQFTLQSTNSTPEKKESALNTQEGKQKKFGKKNKFKPGIICFYCNKEGHYTSDCRTKKRDNDNQQSRSNNNGNRRYGSDQNQHQPNYHNQQSQAQQGQQYQPPQQHRGYQSQQAQAGQPSAAQQPPFQARNNRPQLRGRAEAVIAETNGEIALNMNTTDQERERPWILDSGCTRHMTTTKDLLMNARTLPNAITIKAAFETEKNETNIEGEVRLNSKYKTPVKLQNVLYVPGMRWNLISVKKICQQGATVVFQQENVCHVLFNEKKILKFELNSESLYELVTEKKIDLEEDSTEQEESVEQALTTVEEWHERLGHLSISGLKKLQDIENIPYLELKGNEDIHCQACTKGKKARDPFKVRKELETKEVGELIHTDVCGPIQPASFGGNHYFVSYTDDYSRYSKVYLMKNKSEQPEKFKEFRNYLKNQFKIKIKTLRSDSGGEYTSNEFEDYLKKKGIEHQSKPPRTPQWRGVSERLNRTLWDKARCLLKGRNLPNHFWGEAISYANDLKNISPTKMLQVTPYEVLFQRKPNYEKMKIFGSKIEFKNNDEEKKLDDRTTSGIYLGYDKTMKCSRVFIPTTKKVTFARELIFFENDLNYFEEESPLPEFVKEDEPEKLIILDDEDSEEESNDQKENERERRMNVDEQPDQRVFVRIEPIQAVPNDPNPHQRPTRIRKQTKFFEEEQVMLALDEGEPNTFQEVLESEDRENWIEATKKEIENLYENDTFEFVEKKNQSIVSSKWVYKLKKKPNGEIDKYKARLVARGFSQTQGVDFYETFAPTLRMETIRYLCALNCHLGYRIHHMDVNGAFLQGDLEEEIYIEVPHGFALLHEDPKYFEGKVAKLLKPLYGLKQAMRRWNIKITTYLKSRNFTQSQADPSLFFKKDQEGRLTTVLAIYVDDCIILGTKQGISEAKIILTKQFSMTDLGEMTGILGVNVVQSEEGVSLDQEAYLEKVLKIFGMSQCRPISTPAIFEKESTSQESSSSVDQKEYRKAVGSLLYLSKSTRPDITFAVNQVAQKVENPTQSDWIKLKRIFRYLRGTSKLALTYSRKDFKISGYSDASYAMNEDRKSTSGYAFMTNGACITWRSKKQPITTTSSMEAEFVALSSAVKEALWIRKLNIELLNDTEAVEVFEDNQACIRFSHDFIHSDRTKHIDVRYYFVRENVEEKKIKLTYCPTTEMIADVLTKPLGSVLFVKFIQLLGLKERIQNQK